VSRRGWLLFWSLGVIWGIPYLLIKVAVQEMAPSVLVCLRVALAAVCLLPLAAARGWLRPALRRWRWVAVFAVVEIAVPFGLLSWAETRISSSLTGLLVAAVPLFAAALATVFGLDDAPSGLRLVGLLVGVSGVACLVGLDVRGGNLLAVAAVVATAFCYALGPMIATLRLADVSSMAVSGVAMAITAVAYLPATIGQWPAGGLRGVSWTAWACVAVLGVVCSALAFVLLFALISEVGPARTTVITYINPAVAVALGVLLLDEPLTVGLLIGFPLVLVGSRLATANSGGRTARAEAIGPRGSS
jgi:drug/metabolite transporter (DMT)-like permease